MHGDGTRKIQFSWFFVCRTICPYIKSKVDTGDVKNGAVKQKRAMTLLQKMTGQGAGTTPTNPKLA